MASKINIFQFSDYRELLIKLIEQRKKEKNVFSYRWFSQRAGLSAPNFLNLVVKGKRDLSAHTVEKVIEIFQLSKDEGEFFRHLVRFNKAKTLTDKEDCARQLIRLKKFQKEFPLSKDQFEYYSNWYHIPVRELLTLKDGPQSDEEIAQRLIPSISKMEAAQALNKLLALNLIQKKVGRWVLKEENISTGHKFASYGVVQYHKKMLELAANSLDLFESKEREISSVTIGLSEEKFLQIKKLIEEFRSQLMNLAAEDANKEKIYQINFQLFPLSQSKENRG